eukprot:GHVU01059374.1.p1 GENE.GHVU01059374.1~~GHVU01059374.1.p1  ORF type:complete len:104 (+),score=5.88 GHVU01059374.1:134-445(+)
MHNLLILDFSYSSVVVDDDVRVVRCDNLPRLRVLRVAGCKKLTDEALDHVCIGLHELQLLDIAYIYIYNMRVSWTSLSRLRNTQRVNLDECRLVSPASILQLC